MLGGFLRQEIRGRSAWWHYRPFMLSSRLAGLPAHALARRAGSFKNLVLRG